MRKSKSAVVLAGGVVSLYAAADFLTAAVGKQIDNELEPPPVASVNVVSSTTTFTTSHAITFNTITDEQRSVEQPTQAKPGVRLWTYRD